MTVKVLKVLLMYVVTTVQAQLWSDFYHYRGELIFSDEFDTLNTSTWQHVITGWRGGNDEFEFYHNHPENSYVRDGVLYLKPTLTADRYGEDFLYNGTLDLWDEGCNVNYLDGCIIKAGEDILNPITSARIRTINSFSFTYGTVEIRAKMPRGDWIWPAMWLMPTNNAFGAWPRSGEIDMVEIRSNDDINCHGKQKGNTLMGATVHFGLNATTDKWRKTHYEAVLSEGSFADDFHVYGLQRLHDSIRLYVDGIPIGQVSPPQEGFWELGGFDDQLTNIWANGTNMTPFDHPFHLIMNVAVGGNFFNDYCTYADESRNKPWKWKSATAMRDFWEAKDNWYPTWDVESENNALQVDYVRVYALDMNNIGNYHWYQTDQSNDIN